MMRSRRLADICTLQRAARMCARPQHAHDQQIASPDSRDVFPIHRILARRAVLGLASLHARSGWEVGRRSRGGEDPAMARMELVQRQHNSDVRLCWEEMI
jgi:hypothetical protein